ncbi:MAG: GNAT family N-acetyltransferase [Candidatus Hodarchaeota archaeon]
MNRVKIRKAESSDKEIVLKFCEKTWEWGDYISLVWDRWIQDTKGEFFVGSINKRPVGICRVRLAKSGEAWFEGLRVDPQYRQQGIATLLNQECFSFAKHEGAEIGRACIVSTNEVAQSLAKKLGFRLVTEFVHLECEPYRFKDDGCTRWGNMEDIEAISGFLKNSAVYAKSSGLYTIIFVWLSLEREDVEMFVQTKKALVYEKKGKIRGVIFIDDRIEQAWNTRAIQTCYIDGDAESVGHMVGFLLNYAAKRKLEKIYAFTCNLEPIVNKLREMGFEPSDEYTLLVFEKGI